MKALIFGISGQDGALLARHLLERGYEVVGTSRDAQVSSLGNLLKLGVRERVRMASAAINDFRSVLQLLARVDPDEIYNLAGQTSVGLSFELPVETLESIAVGTLNILEALRFLGKAGEVLQRGFERMFRGKRGARRRRGIAVSSAQPVRGGQGDGVLGGGELPGSVRAVRVLGDFVQPRVGAAAGAVRDAEDRGRELAASPRRAGRGSCTWAT